MGVAEVLEVGLSGPTALPWSFFFLPPFAKMRVAVFPLIVMLFGHERKSGC
jgi:hypothetical protein